MASRGANHLNGNRESQVDIRQRDHKRLLISQDHVKLMLGSKNIEWKNVIDKSLITGSLERSVSPMRGQGGSSVEQHLVSQSYITPQEQFQPKKGLRSRMADGTYTIKRG